MTASDRLARIAPYVWRLLEDEHIQDQLGHAITGATTKLDLDSTRHLPPCPRCGNGKRHTVTGGDSVEDPYPNR